MSPRAGPRGGDRDCNPRTPETARAAPSCPRPQVCQERAVVSGSQNRSPLGGQVTKATSLPLTINSPS